MSQSPIEMAAEADMLDGYRDGRQDDRAEFPPTSNRTAAYRQGWLNGRDDRLAKPRAAASTLRAEADAILALVPGRVE